MLVIIHEAVKGKVLVGRGDQRAGSTRVNKTEQGKQDRTREGTGGEIRVVGLVIYAWLLLSSLRMRRILRIKRWRLFLKSPASLGSFSSSWRTLPGSKLKP